MVLSVIRRCKHLVRGCLMNVVYERGTIFKTYQVVEESSKYYIYCISNYDGEIRKMRNKYGPIVFYDKDTAIRFVDKLK